VTARKLGFNALEWLVEAGSLSTNPLMSVTGREEIKQAVSANGVQVASICAHCVLQWRPFDEGGAARATLFNEVVLAAGAAKMERVVVPILEEATVAKAGSLALAAGIFRSVVRVAETAKVDLAFEMDRPAEECREFIELLGSPRAKLCYDSGNATSLGFDIIREIKALLPVVAEIHLKDRRVGGASQPLGCGDTKFGDFFQTLKAQNWRGPFVFETPVLDDPAGQAQQNLQFVSEFWS